MSIYFITGDLGSGKTKSAVAKLQEYLLSNKKIATNLDIFPEYLVPHNNKNSITRLPDKPRPQDLIDIGTGDGNKHDDRESYNENNFGCLIFDECSLWLNSRSKKDNERAKMIDWCTHSRKYRWDIFFLLPCHKHIDPQILEALCENLVKVSRWDKLSIPFFSFWMSFISFGYLKIKMPKIHLAKVFYGYERSAMLVDRWFSYGTSLYKGYNTGQAFRSDVLFIGEHSIDMRASYCLLSAWHLKGRYQKHWRERLLIILNSILNNVVRFILSHNDRALARRHDEKQTKAKSYLVRTVSNEDKPIIVDFDNTYLFPDITTEGLPWILMKQAE